MAETEEASELIDGVRASRLLRLAPAAVYEAADRGELQHRRDAAGFIRFERSMLAAWPHHEPEAYERAVRRSVELHRLHMERHPELKDSTLAEARRLGIPL